MSTKSTNLPAPLTPADCDLTDFKFMPLEVGRLRRSKAWLICKRRPELGFFMLNLWSTAWHERPAASIENDDDVLADAAMCAPDHWAEVKQEVLRGWKLCSDGRLYHPIVAEKALEAWFDKQIHRWEKECDRIRKDNKRRSDVGQPSADFPPRPERKEAGRLPDVQRKSGGIPAENALKGREGNIRDKQRDSSAGIPADGDDGFADWWAAYPRQVGKGAALKKYREALKKADAATLLAGAKAAADRYARSQTEERFIPHPATWLNQDRWLDGQAPTLETVDDQGLREKLNAQRLRAWNERGEWEPHWGARPSRRPIDKLPEAA